MKIELNKKETEALKFIQELFNEKNSDKIILFLFRKGMQAISQQFKNLNTDQRELLNLFITKDNVQSTSNNK